MSDLSAAERVLLHVVLGLLYDKRDRERAEWNELAPPPQRQWDRFRRWLNRRLGLQRHDEALAVYRRVAAIRESDRLTEENLQLIRQLLNQPAPPDNVKRIGPAILPPNDSPPSA